MSEESEELKEIKKKLVQVDRKLDRLLSMQTESHSGREVVPDTLASLPEHLKKTAQAIAAMGEATAEQVAAKTGKTRAAESDYLNQLASRRFLKKERRGREVYFQVFALYTICPQCRARVAMTLGHCPLCGGPLSHKLLE